MSDLDPLLLLNAYTTGIFPMADSRDADKLYWVEPSERAIIPLDRFHVSRSLRSTIQSDRFRVTHDQAFGEVVRRCADRGETWINQVIERAVGKLHLMGRAHSIEIWSGDDLVGGLYGVRIGRAFFGESMFSNVTDASKVALAWLVARMKVGGFTLLDCQLMTDHLRSMGAIEIPRDAYVKLLSAAVASGGGVGDPGTGEAGDFAALDELLEGADMAGAGGPSGKVIAQLLTQTS